MPSYQWVCSNPKCEHKWEFIGLIREMEGHKQCPKCGADGEFDWSSGQAPNWSFKQRF